MAVANIDMMLLRPFEDGIPVDTFVCNIELHPWPIIPVYPVKRIECEIGLTHDDLAKVIDTMVDVFGNQLAFFENELFGL